MHCVDQFPDETLCDMIKELISLRLPSRLLYMYINDVICSLLHYITVFSARPTTTRVGLAVRMSTMLKTRSVKIKSR